MAGITLRTARQVVPMIYAYTTPEIARHNGWTKIGYTEQSVDKRLKQQTHTADVLYHEEWRGNAVYGVHRPRFPRLPPQAERGERPQKRVVPSGWAAVPAVFSGFPHEPGPGAAGCRHRLYPAGRTGKSCPRHQNLLPEPPRRGIPLERQAPLWQDPFHLRFLQAGGCTDGAHRHKPPCHRQ